VEPEREQLESIASRIEHGELRVFVDRTIPLALAPEAYRQSIPRQGPGKMAVKMA
jgi:NADPH:quinone reductase-like Zn-dependent oxidoreductase